MITEQTQQPALGPCPTVSVGLPPSNAAEKTSQMLSDAASKRSTTGKHKNGQLVEIYDADFTHVVCVPPEKILHTPHPNLGVSRLVLCRNFDGSCDATSEGQCTKGSQCKFVHADTLGARKMPIHVNYAWRSEESVIYPRLPSGETLAVLAPNDRPPEDHVPSERVLVTRGSLMRHEHPGSLSHCAHYYFNRMCNRGERCNFIHAVTIDPNAQDFQRAPAPTAIAPLTRQQQQQQHQHVDHAQRAGSNSRMASSTASTQTTAGGLSGSPSIPAQLVNQQLPPPPMGPAILYPTATSPFIAQPQSTPPPPFLFNIAPAPPPPTLLQPIMFAPAPTATMIPSMTSFFLVPAAMPPAPTLIPQTNPMDWSQFQSVFNNSTTTPLSHSTSGSQQLKRL